MCHPLEQRWHLHVSVTNGHQRGKLRHQPTSTTCFAAGTAETPASNADLDRIAQFVDPLKTAGGVAILRLFTKPARL